MKKKTPKQIGVAVSFVCLEAGYMLFWLPFAEPSRLLVEALSSCCEVALVALSIACHATADFRTSRVVDKIMVGVMVTDVLVMMLWQGYQFTIIYFTAKFHKKTKVRIFFLRVTCRH
jgi:hypothetical protein